MAEWAEANREHRGLLNSFTCAPKPEPVGPGIWHKKHYNAPWAHSVQKKIRALRTPLKMPNRADVLQETDSSRLNAVVVLRSSPVNDKEHRFLLLFLARHLECSKQGLGDEAMDYFMETCFNMVEEMPDIETVYFEAEAHKQNAPVHALLEAHGWEAAEDMPDDADYQAWRLTKPIE